MKKLQHWEKKQYASLEAYRASREKYNALRREMRAARKREHRECYEIHCPVCGNTTEFGSHPHIAFCSDDCAAKWSRIRDRGEKEKVLSKGNIIREFNCRECGKEVYITDTGDLRRAFCSNACCVKYWERESAMHKGSGRRGDNLGMSGGMSLGSLIRREAMDLS